MLLVSDHGNKNGLLDFVNPTARDLVTTSHAQGTLLTRCKGPIVQSHPTDRSVSGQVPTDENSNYQTNTHAEAVDRLVEQHLLSPRAVPFEPFGRYRTRMYLVPTTWLLALEDKVISKMEFSILVKIKASTIDANCPDYTFDTAAAANYYGASQQKVKRSISKLIRLEMLRFSIQEDGSHRLEIYDFYPQTKS